jgi:hypothetical protein
MFPTILVSVGGKNGRITDQAREISSGHLVDDSGSGIPVPAFFLSEYASIGKTSRDTRTLTVISRSAVTLFSAPLMTCPAANVVTSAT